jgi:dTDP-4-amino-4,6-dideoxygalactose transaminase
MIPFLDLQAQYQAIGSELEAAVVGVMRRGEFVLGSSVEAFEEKFAAYCGAKHCVALNTGTSALHLALLALGIGPGDEVITVPMTFIATVAAIRYANATPVFVDIDPDTWTMDAGQIEAAITPHTKAILPVHLHGRLADMTAIQAVARRHGIAVIEDCAQAHGAEQAGKCAGTFGVIGCFSFYPGKNLGACGEGGALVTDRDDYAAAARQLRDWGQTSKYHHERHGFNYRMDGIQGAVLEAKLRYLPAWTRSRQAAAALYDDLLADVAVGTPKVPAHLEHVYHVYAIRTPGRDQVQAALKNAGVATNVHYPRPVHLQRAYADLGHKAGDFPVSEAVAADTLSLPMFAELTRDQIATVSGSVQRICGSRRSHAAIAAE